MKIAVISGSHRPTGNSGRIARKVQALLEGKGNEVFLLDLAATDLPFWDEGLWGAEGLAAKWSAVWAPVEKQLAAADAYVIVAPEYHGMAPSKLMNLFLLLGNGPTVAHKPALLVAVSAGISGAYPIAELRAFSTKNNRMSYIPEHLIVRHAGEMLVDNVKPEHADANAIVADRLGWLLDLLGDYAEAFAAMRAKGRASNAKYANGM